MASRFQSGGTVLASGIRTRTKKERKLYSDEWALGDEEIEGYHTFDLEEKISSEKFNINLVKDMSNEDFGLSYFQEHGFTQPLVFRVKGNLGIVVPDSNFSVNDVRLSVGSRRMVDVMDVNTQKNVEMTMKDWQRYYESHDKDKLLNVISLEFSHTKLEHLVQAPTVVRQMDWVDCVWPRHLKEAQTESTNVLEDMMYPKVQKYVLMSVNGCYTDFHVDFGGTSVWYHLLKGRKFFWLIPPTDKNLRAYENWVLSGKQNNIFFADTVDACDRIELFAGNTFFIPTGWIHAVYTPEDALVFGGNFLHSFNIDKQLRVAQTEDVTHVPQKFRYPFFTEMLWYVLERYVHVLLKKTHLNLPPEEEEKQLKAFAAAKVIPDEKCHLSPFELHGLKSIVMHLHSLPTSRKCVPDLITDPIALIRDVRTVVEMHRADDPKLAVSGKPVLQWWSREGVRYGVKRPSLGTEGVGVKRKRRDSDDGRTAGLPPNAAKVKHRRIRCKACDACLRDDCRSCVYCNDMVKYGGPGTMKQTCKLKKCHQPILPVMALCYVCSLDGWGRPFVALPHKPPNTKVPSDLMECCICYKISHPKCMRSEFEVKGKVSEELPNCWECPDCINQGYNKEYKHNRVSGTTRSDVGSDANPKTPTAMSDVEEPRVKVEVEEKENMMQEETMEQEKKEEILKEETEKQTQKKAEVTTFGETLDMTPHLPTWQELQRRVVKPLVRPMWVVRPAGPPPEEDEDGDDTDSEEGAPPPKPVVPAVLNREVVLPVLARLGVKDLLSAMRVCRQWAQWAIHPSLWTKISVNQRSLDELCLAGIVRRQPKVLSLNWSKVTQEQMMWLLARLPQLSHLHLEGLSWSQVSSLASPYCPPLSTLNLSFCEGITDATLATLLSPPRHHRPGHRDIVTRLRRLSHLQLAGTEVSDDGMRSIIRSLPFLTHLDISNCSKVNEGTVALLVQPSSVVSHSLTSLDIRGCCCLGPMCLPSLVCLPKLTHLAVYPGTHIPMPALKVWGKSYGYSFDEENFMTRQAAHCQELNSDRFDGELSTHCTRGSGARDSEKNCSLKGHTKKSNEKLKDGIEIVDLKHKTFSKLKNSNESSDSNSGKPESVDHKSLRQDEEKSVIKQEKIKNICQPTTTTKRVYRKRAKNPAGKITDNKSQDSQECKDFILETVNEASTSPGKTLLIAMPVKAGIKKICAKSKLSEPQKESKKTVMKKIEKQTNDSNPRSQKITPTRNEKITASKIEKSTQKNERNTNRKVGHKITPSKNDLATKTFRKEQKTPIIHKVEPRKRDISINETPVAKTRRKMDGNFSEEKTEGHEGKLDGKKCLTKLQKKIGVKRPGRDVMKESFKKCSDSTRESRRGDSPVEGESPTHESGRSAIGRERSVSRERPERVHRLPRRLSM